MNSLKNKQTINLNVSVEMTFFHFYFFENHILFLLYFVPLPFIPFIPLPPEITTLLSMPMSLSFLFAQSLYPLPSPIAFILVSIYEFVSTLLVISVCSLDSIYE